ncbi:MAG: hypothetical protein ACYC90_10920 [Candidatus Nanopelagicales bacterium]
MTDPKPDKSDDAPEQPAEPVRRLPKGYQPTATVIGYRGSVPLLRRTRRRDAEKHSN